MPRSFWNPHSPDTLGVEFAGVGITNNVIASNTDMYALRFKAQRTGFVDQVSVYSGSLTSNQTIPYPYGYLGQRRPWIVELIPVSGFDPGAIQVAFFNMALTAYSDVLDESFGTPAGDELNLPDDGKALFQSGPNPASMTVECSDASTFPLTAHVLSLGVDVNVYSQAYVERIDQSGTSTWIRHFGSSVFGTVTQHIAEAYQESGSPGTWKLWTPSDVRQFDAGVGNRRLRMRAVDTQPNIFDYLNLHVDYVNERRAGVGLVVPTGPWQWMNATFRRPGTTAAVPITTGVEYVVVIRPPCAQNDYQAPGRRLDVDFLSDRKLGGVTPQHYTFLDWDGYTLQNRTNNTSFAIPYALGTQLQGLPAIRMFSGNSEVVDTQPYDSYYSGAQPVKAADTTNRTRHYLANAPVGTTRYRYLRVNMSLVQHAVQPDFKGAVDVSIKTAAESLIAGPIRVDETMWRQFDIIGNDVWGDEYRSVLLDFGTAFDIIDGQTTIIDFALSDDTPVQGTGLEVDNPWRIGSLISSVIGVTGSDQTAPSAQSAVGISYPYPTGARFNIGSLAASKRSDLQVMLISEVPAITGTAVSVQSLAVSGGACSGCTTSAAAQPRIIGTGTGVASADSVSTVTLVPPLPTQEILEDDVLLCLASVRNYSVGTVNVPPGWTQIATNVQGNLRLFAKNAIGGGFDVPPQIRFTGGASNETALAQCAVARGVRTDLSTIVTNSATGNFVAAQDLPWAALSTSVTELGLRMGFKQDDWTSVNASAGFTRIGDVSSTLGSDSSMLWDYITNSLGWFGGSWVVNGGAAAISTYTSIALAAGTTTTSDIAAHTCYVRGITYNRVCWTRTTLPQETFVHYEVQRLEPDTVDPSWNTVAYIEPSSAIVVSGAPVTGAATCFDDYSMVYDSRVCYRVRQKRVDGGLSDFAETICVTTPAPTGADLIITVPGQPELSVAFAEAHTSLPIEHEWEVLDAGQQTIRAVYGRDKHFAFRPLEKLGLRFKRRLTISALCTPVSPCLRVADGIRQVVQATTGLVVRDACGNRWYATVVVPSLTQLHDPDIGDLWFADVEVIELSTPVLTEMTAGEVFP